MRKITKRKLRRRISHLLGVLADCVGKPRDAELIALYHTVRDIQPLLCRAIAEQHECREMLDRGLSEWVEAYREPIFSDAEMFKTGCSLWADEFED